MCAVIFLEAKRERGKLSAAPFIDAWKMRQNNHWVPYWWWVEMLNSWKRMFPFRKPIDYFLHYLNVFRRVRSPQPRTLVPTHYLTQNSKSSCHASLDTNCKELILKSENDKGLIETEDSFLWSHKELCFGHDREFLDGSNVCVQIISKCILKSA